MATNNITGDNLISKANSIGRGRQMNDWSHHLVKLEQLTRKLTDTLNEREYIQSMDIIIDCKRELDKAQNAVYRELANG
jgi:hypothetical protein